MSISRRGAVLALGQIALRGAIAIYALVLVHLLSRTEFGNFSTVIAVLAVGGAIADGGFSRLLMRDVARAETGRDGLVGALVLVRAVWTSVVVVSMVFGFGLGGLENVSTLAVFLAIAVLGFESLAAGFEAAGIGADLPWRVSHGQLIGAVLLLLALVALLLGGADLERALAGMLVASAAKAVWQIRRWRGVLVRGAVRVAAARAPRWAREAAPFLVVSLIGTLYYRLDIIILRVQTSAEETAAYGAAYRVVDAALIAGGVAAAAVTAQLSRLHAQEPRSVWHVWKTYARLIVVSATPVCVVLVVFAESVAGLLFGEGYREEAGQVLGILAPGIVFMLLQILNAAIIFTSDVQRLIIRLGLSQLVLNVVLTFVLVDAYQAPGAAAATTISEVLAFACWAAYIRRRFGPRARPSQTVVTAGG